MKSFHHTKKKEDEIDLKNKTVIFHPLTNGQKAWVHQKYFAEGIKDFCSDEPIDNPVQDEILKNFARLSRAKAILKIRWEKFNGILKAKGMGRSKK